MRLAVATEMFLVELLRLRRHRPLLAFAFLLSVGVAVTSFGYDAIQHAADPSHHLPAGGMYHFTRAVRTLGLLFGALTAALIGTEGGTADIASGVYTDLVATGCSRPALFLIRVPAAAIVTLIFTGAAFLVAVGGTFLFAGPLATPDAQLVIESAGWVLLCNVLVVTLAVAVGSATGSRAIALTAVIGWETVATSLLLNASSLGSARDAVLNAPLAQLLPFGPPPGIRMATGVAIIVLVAWLVVPSTVAGWRTAYKDP